MDATVIIPTYRDWTSLRTCLDCLSGQTVDPSRFEILVVNNAPEFPPPEGFDLPANARILSEAKPGSYAARNAGIGAARSENLFFTDADCRPMPDYLENGLEALAARPEVLRFAGAVELVPAQDRWTAPELYDRLTSLRQERYASQGRAATANLFVRKSAFDQIGLFDAEALSGGDMEWSARAQAAGLTLLYVPEVLVLHPARRSYAEHATKQRRLLGAKLRRLAQENRRGSIPPLRKALPPTGLLRRALREHDIDARQAFQVWALQYRLRLAMIGEHVRLTWLKRAPERR